MINLLIHNPLLLLFLVAAIGYALGHITIAGSSLGVAAVLFVGLAFGALHPDLKLPELIYQLGLVLFVYTIGLGSGRSFFRSLRRKGLRDNLLVVAVLLLAASATAVAARLLGLRPTLAAGLFAGSLTNTPALAAVLDNVRASAPAAIAERLLADPVVGYSITYPMGVVAMIVRIAVMRRVWKVDYALEAEQLGELGAAGHPLENRTIVVTGPGGTGRTVRALVEQHGWNIVFGRLKRNGHSDVISGDTRLEEGDLVTTIGKVDDLDRATVCLGRESAEHIELDRHELDYRRIFVSSPTVAGHRLRDLDLPRRLGGFVTRVRRGDVDLLPHGDTVLELGDRVRVLAHRERLDAISKFFGDSYRALSEIDILTFNLGLALGLLVGMIPIPLPGGVVIGLGIAGGPLIVALVLGALGRTGPLVWSLPYSANLTLRQVGLILFLAGVGTRSGYAFATMLLDGGAFAIFVAGTLITTGVALLSLWLGYRRLHIPMNLLIGMLAGIQTQPAVLGYTLEQTENDLPNVGYAAVYPVALILKIVLAQLLLALLR